MRSSVVRALVSLVAVAQVARGQATSSSIAPYIAPAFPEDLVSAKKADRVAWLAYDHGQRNVYTAAAPDFKPVRLSKFLNDDGIVLSDLSISDDGSTVTFLRGGLPNTRGWIAVPTSDPNGGESAVWAAKTDGTGAWRLGEGSAPSLSPDARTVAFVKDGQIFSYRIARGATDSIDVGKKALIRVWGRNTSPRWSPDGRRLAFVSVRDNHSFVGVYDVKARRVDFMAPSVDFDAGPSWSSDGKRLAFVRRPGTPFGQQAQRGDGSIGNPGGPAMAAGRGGRGVVSTGRADGLYRAEFRGGYTISLMVADVATGKADEVWHNQPADKTFPNVNAIAFAGDNLIFQQEPEEWIRWYSVSAKGGTITPIELTPGTGAVESLNLSPDGSTLFYATNAGDIDRRHIWKVATSGGPATQITSGAEIEMYPAPLASGKQIAVLSSSATRPMQVGIVPLGGGAPKLVFPVLTKEFLATTQVTPEPILLKAEDGLEFHNQLFLPKGMQPGERRPAIVFVHGGPVRQMLLGYHYMDFYHMSYAVNQWLASQGYIVMSVNYRSGIGYGKSFRTAANTGGRGNAEYKDVIAAGKYLQTRADVDPTRVGIWGLSYGGVLTAQALARNSDVFAAGVDMAGVHLWGNSLDSGDVSYKSSAISAIDGWKSPVLIWHNDDDRNVEFSQTIGLVDLLRARNVYYELIVNPDDTHETLLHRRWLETYARMDTFLDRFLRKRSVSSR
ncbi:MAG TPA: prolyl oligopeptidase family serine peptidase [Gemmatimonadaceae bacterium]|nr:prolyl oligopeptidase family serine peptidase [Gemmatimonadaceae bacterium]